MADMSPLVDIRVPLEKVMTKRRPRFDGHHAYHDSEYTAELEAFRIDAWIANGQREPTVSRVSAAIVFEGPREPAGDVDNLVGFVLDGLQTDRGRGGGPGVIQNDRQVRFPFGLAYVEAPDWAVRVKLEELPPLEKKARGRKAGASRPVEVQARGR